MFACINLSLYFGGLISVFHLVAPSSGQVRDFEIGEVPEPETRDRNDRAGENGVKGKACGWTLRGINPVTSPELMG